VYWAEDPQARAIEEKSGVAITTWDFEHDRLVYRITGVPDAGVPLASNTIRSRDTIGKPP
jgi:hypothetical protein